MNSRFRDILLSRPSTQVLDKLAREMGMKTILEDGLNRVAQKITTKEELYRVLEKEQMEHDTGNNKFSMGNE